MTNPGKLLVLCFLAWCHLNLSAQTISGELKVWHKVTLSVAGPTTSEEDVINPFSDYRLNVTFTQGEKSYIVPGYYAADGNAGETGESHGNTWKVHFAPDAPGEWNYVIAFHQGEDVAIDETVAGIALPGNGNTGSFTIIPSDKQGSDFRHHGRVAYVGERYLRHLGTGKYFLKIGADSPETLLAYKDFDQTWLITTGAPLKTWQPHIQDWKEGDPVWRDTLGKGIIGAVNYLAAEGQNAISFLTMNIDGDGDNVWPFIHPDTHDRYDCSKLDQWEIFFAHCDKLGIKLHVKTQEQENDQLLDGGQLSRTRKLYYRELIARFGHHLGITWNLGEENSNTVAQRKAFAEYFRTNDPYQHPVVLHTFPDDDEEVYLPMLGDQSEVTGASLQADWSDIHEMTLKWVNASAQTGKPWVVSNDEQGIAFIGVPPDGFQGPPTQDEIRRSVLWGNLMAGGAGVEYYFGYALPQNDLNCEDFRSRDQMWDYNRHATTFFQEYLPFASMENANALLTERSANDYCFALADSVYAYFDADGDAGPIDLSAASGAFEVWWYDPVNGGALQTGSIETIDAGQQVSPGNAPGNVLYDWVILLKRVTNIQPTISLHAIPAGCGSVLLSWQNTAGWSNPTIEMSTDAVFFMTLASQAEIFCGNTCSAKVRVNSGMTWFRLRKGDQISQVAACHMPCFLAPQVILPLKPKLSRQ